MTGKYVCLTSETAEETGIGYPLYTVGFYHPNGKWEPDSDHGGENGKIEAMDRVAYLNGTPTHVWIAQWNADEDADRDGVRDEVILQAFKSLESAQRACREVLEDTFEGEISSMRIEWTRVPPSGERHHYKGRVEASVDGYFDIWRVPLV